MRKFSFSFFFFYRIGKNEPINRLKTWEGPMYLDDRLKAFKNKIKGEKKKMMDWHVVLMRCVRLCMRATAREVHMRSACHEQSGVLKLLLTDSRFILHGYGRFVIN